MEKGESNVDQVTALLELAKVKKENIISFKGQGLKLDTKADARGVVEAIQACKDLQALELVGNTVGVEAAQLIAEALKKRPELERCLWSDMFTGRLRSEIPKSLRCLGDAIIEANAHLVEIDLSDNAFGPDGVKACIELLKSRCAYTIQELRFNNNGLGGGGIILADTLIECHERSVVQGKPLALKVFVAGRNRLEDPGAKALAKAFKTIGTLEEIHLPQNGIRHQGIAALAETVKHSPSLKHLNLNDNTFTEEGAIPMAEGIKNINSLEIINFGDCLVRTEGAKAIGEALKNSNPDLKELILSFGEIQLEGGLKICDALSGKEMLKKLDLNGNQFGEDGVEEVKDLAKEFCSSSVLGSLSDDEGSDSESDEDSSSESQSSDTRIDEIVNGSIYNEEPSSTLVNGNADKPETLLTPKNFLSSVTASSLISMSSSKRVNLLEEVAELVTNAESTANACVVLSELLKEDCIENMISCKNPQAEKLRSCVFECIDVLIADAFEKYPNTPMLVVNPLLVKMGLIKSESKKDKPVGKMQAMVVILGHICQQAYFPKFLKSIVRSLVAKENHRWDQSPFLRTQLMQILYA
ncbi:ran GTPase-activating protein 1-like [Clavelina lepadiformis]|uniref:ran GTPase-activating protein 1-like n=1 Tax=Clavelina lepadiformis TaxID=159417 RepID=UPI0040427D3C